MAAINHVVVLMLENRSFDCMLGRLYPKSDGFDGLSGEETNPLTTAPDGPVVRVWNAPGADRKTMTIPDPDPGELFPDMNVQIFGAGGDTSKPATMQGFVLDYLAQKTPGEQADAVMHYFTPEQVPVISTLATTFTCSDRWHASAPCQTWPNRCFVHCATAGGHVNNEPDKLPFKMKSIYEQLDEVEKSWKIYFHDLPQAAVLENVWSSGFLNFRLFEQEFAKDAASGKLPNYSFIEPRYFADGPLNLIPNDEHPPHNVHYGEQLIATIYNALRSGPSWAETLFIVTYDEHGGCFDHVPPPAAASPDPGPGPEGFSFDRYGVRVPALIISPYLKAPGQIARPPAGSAYPFDHTSILATLRQIFGLKGPLTGRDAVAPDLLHLLDLDGPMLDTPASIEAPDTKPAPGEGAALAAAPANDMQHSLCKMAVRLPVAEAEIMAHVSGFLRRFQGS
ncbi:MAG TPA: alkaline phosphatase family protein [Aliidongia sp.]|nr:alkaline phosphatase family protein [Aliidongia sp.]